MKVISFHQSTRVMGFAIFVDGKYFRSGIIDLSKIKNIEERTREAEIALCKEISLNQPDIVVIEDIHNQSSDPTAILLAKLQGMVLGYCAAHNIRVEVVSSEQMEKYGATNHNVDWTKERLGINIEFENEATAIVVNDIAHRVCEFGGL